MIVRKPADEIPNGIFDGAARFNNLGPLVEDTYGYAVSVEDGPDGAGVGTLVFIPHVTLSELEDMIEDDDNEAK